jgi:hypothetical protein
MIFLLANAEVPYRALDCRNVLLSCQSQYVLWLDLKVLMIDSQIVDLHGLCTFYSNTSRVLTIQFLFKAAAFRKYFMFFCYHLWWIKELESATPETKRNHYETGTLPASQQHKMFVSV